MNCYTNNISKVTISDSFSYLHYWWMDIATTCLKYAWLFCLQSALNCWKKCYCHISYLFEEAVFWNVTAGGLVDIHWLYFIHHCSRSLAAQLKINHDVGHCWLRNKGALFSQSAPVKLKFIMIDRRAVLIIAGIVWWWKLHIYFVISKTWSQI